MRRGVTAALAVMAVATGCATTTPTGIRGVRTFAGAGLSFRYPRTWHAAPWGDSPLGAFGNPVVYLSTAPLHAPCVTRGSTTTCTVPLATVPPGGLLVTWGRFAKPGGATTVSSPNTTIAQRSAQVSRSTSAPVVATACTGMHATQSVTAAIELSADNELTMVACLRGPGTARHRSEVTAMLRSLTLTTG